MLFPPWEFVYKVLLGFRGEAIHEDIAEIECLSDVAMATNFGTALAANGL